MHEQDPLEKQLSTCHSQSIWLTGQMVVARAINPGQIPRSSPGQAIAFANLC